MQFIEVKVDGVWQRVSVDDWWKLGKEPKRCASCHGPVHITQDHSGKRRRGVTHRRGGAECLGDDTILSFRHPNALD
ncbi:hypothetical protein HNO88_004369 [Novosphingobium chloroacetimidivorans]|uniref:Uncharacterized protein n=1 Tax=Novosphingobium chloroacetimidivorans TaxID=1428314 RepID=A0A7W7NY26_9SPHN|nr:hypothetical protein [Novosphingobium chloroacetimidivorans]MBB4861021.1 hypothetical protein [Novosphingobium chloroacetimidivorans]